MEEGWVTAWGAVPPTVASTTTAAAPIQGGWRCRSRGGGRRDGSATCGGMRAAAAVASTTRCVNCGGNGGGGGGDPRGAAATTRTATTRETPATQRGSSTLPPRALASTRPAQSSDTRRMTPATAPPTLPLTAGHAGEPTTACRQDGTATKGWAAGVALESVRPHPPPSSSTYHVPQEPSVRLDAAGFSHPSRDKRRNPPAGKHWHTALGRVRPPLALLSTPSPSYSSAVTGARGGGGARNAAGSGSGTTGTAEGRGRRCARGSTRTPPPKPSTPNAKPQAQTRYQQWIRAGRGAPHAASGAAAVREGDGYSGGTDHPCTIMAHLGARPVAAHSLPGERAAASMVMPPPSTHPHPLHKK